MGTKITTLQKEQHSDDRGLRRPEIQKICLPKSATPIAAGVDQFSFHPIPTWVSRIRRRAYIKLLSTRCPTTSSSQDVDYSRISGRREQLNVCTHNFYISHYPCIPRNLIRRSALPLLITMKSRQCPQVVGLGDEVRACKSGVLHITCFKPCQAVTTAPLPPRKGGRERRREGWLTSNMTSGPEASTFSLQGRLCSASGLST